MRIARRLAFLLVSLVPLIAWIAGIRAAEPGRDDFARLADEYREQARPVMDQFCLGCHSTAQRIGDLDLERFTTLEEVRRETAVWPKVREKLRSGDMPPKYSKQPALEKRKQLRDWVERYLRAEAMVDAGDPGPVVLRRLNNAEYNYTIRDLTGVALNPAREFPADSAAGEGFTNTGNALAMSPALLGKYLDAAKEIARHAVLLPDGFRFSPQSTRRDWTDEILTQIRQLYREFAEVTDLGVGSQVGNLNVHTDTRIGLAGRLPTERYFAATLAERDALSRRRKTVAAVARERGLSPKYLGTLWTSLNASDSSIIMKGLRSRWRVAQPPDAAALAAEVAGWQKGLWIFGPVGLIGRKGGPTRWMEPVTPVVTQHSVRFPIPAAANGKDKAEVVLSLVAGDAGDGNDHDFVVWQQPRLVADGQPDILLRDVRKLTAEPDSAGSAAAMDDAGWGLDPAQFGTHPDGSMIDAASLCVQAPSVIKIRLPGRLAAGRTLVANAVLDPKAGGAGSVQVEVVEGTPAVTSGLLTSEVQVTFSKVTQVFSDRRDVTFVRPFLVAETGTARQRIESSLDSFRSLFPAALCFNQIVPVDEVLTLTLFYREDDHLARLLLDEAEKARLDGLWHELNYVSQSALMRVTALDLLLEVMVGNGVADRSQYDAFLPLRAPFNERAAEFRKELTDSEPKHLDALIDFAGRAYRRPLSVAEAEDLRGLYRQLRNQDLPHDDAFRLTLARVFVASPFLYRLETSPPGSTAAPVSDWELASRLSYFLWASQPDAELRAAAAASTLHRPEVLAKQVRRMLADGRVRRLATEFACQWLHIYDFDTVEEKSEKHFPEFASLRGDMYEESILFFTDLFQRDASLLNLLDADYTYLNERLADFYGIKGVKGAEWRRIEGVQRQGRGGILGLSTTLARQSGASRTSPILRGNWVSEVLLGDKLPRPPQDVPQLPADEISTDGLTVRELVARHTSEARCATCHKRIDPFGFALEGYDAVGRRREKDLAGRPIDTRTNLPDGNEITGLPGLREYLLKVRGDAVLRQFYRKLLGYAIGRELRITDEPLLSDLEQRLAKSGYRSSVAIQMIVQSRQFREIRGRDYDVDKAQ